MASPEETVSLSKRIVAGLALGLLWVAACAVVFLPGCAALERSPERVGAFAAVATVAFIDQAKPAERAELAGRVVEVLKVVELAAASDQVSLEELALVAREALPADMPPPRRALALELIGFVQAELQRRVDAGTLVNVRGVLGKMRVYASLYQSS
jgi:hypothetical protein